MDKEFHQTGIDLGICRKVLKFMISKKYLTLNMTLGEAFRHIANAEDDFIRLEKDSKEFIKFKEKKGA